MGSCLCSWDSLDPIVKAPRLCWALQIEHLQPSRGGGRGSVDVLASGGRGAEEREGGGG